MYCGNEGIFESEGSSTTFTTNIPVPKGLGIGTVAATSVSLTWSSDSYATWHRIEYFETPNSKRAASSSTLFAAQQLGTSVTVTNLVPGTNYTFHIYSGMGDSYYEPHGAFITAHTLVSSEHSLSLSLLLDIMQP